MSKKAKKEPSIRKPTGSIQPPDIQSYDPVTFQTNRDRIKQRKALSDWFRSAQSKELEYEGMNQVSIDPKQAAYSKKGDK